jgi:hypothetical protein
MEQWIHDMSIALNKPVALIILIADLAEPFCGIGEHWILFDLVWNDLTENQLKCFYEAWSL